MKRKWTATRYLRLASQVLFLSLTGYAVIRHRIGESLGLAGPHNPAPSVDALSPFGGLETLWAWLSSGQLVSHVQYSDIVLLIALVTLMLLAGAAFCGWICPLGALQEWLYRIRRRFAPGRVIVPPRLDRILRYGRYLVLLLVLILTYSLGSLVYGEYCTTCIRCLECAESCPKPAALGMRTVWRGRTRKLPGWAYGAIAGGLFAGIILLSMASGLWHSKPSAAPPSANAVTGLVDPLEIKGWHTLQEITDIYGMPTSVLLEELGLEMTMPAATRVKDLESQASRDGSMVDLTLVRDIVGRWQANQRLGSGSRAH